MARPRFTPALAKSSNAPPADNAAQLRKSAGEPTIQDRIPLKSFLDTTDGRSTWFHREQTEPHAMDCCHCIDHFCGATEVDDLLQHSAHSPKKRPHLFSSSSESNLRSHLETVLSRL